MKHLIIYSHFNPESFTKAIVNVVETESKKRGDEVRMTDLYKDGFDPVLKFPDIQGMFMGGDTPSDVQKYQDDIVWADHITYVFPLWWGQMPAILKGYADRVLSNGFAFNYTETGVDGLLSDKKCNVIVCHGNPSDYYVSTNMHSALERVFDGGVFGFCGIDTKLTFFGSVTSTNNEVRKGYLEEVKGLYTS